MHIDVTLELMSQVTISFGTRIRTFQKKTCAAFSTHELEREQAARVRRQDKIKKAAAETNSNDQKGKKPTAETKSNAQKGTKTTTKTNSQPQKSSSGRQLKQFNLNTYKYHALGDYCNTIRRFGTTDSYSTQPVGLLL
jgi:Tfp pilus assembly protein PilP